MAQPLPFLVDGINVWNVECVLSTGCFERVFLCGRLYPLKVKRGFQKRVAARFDTGTLPRPSVFVHGVNVTRIGAIRPNEHASGLLTLYCTGRKYSIDLPDAPKDLLTCIEARLAELANYNDAKYFEPGNPGAMQAAQHFAESKQHALM
jgi:hypothetical protein